MAEVGSLSAKLTLDKAAFSSGIASAKGELSSFGAAVSSIGSTITTVMKGAALAVGGLTAVVGVGTKAFMEYEKGLANIGKISGMADNELTAFGRTVRDMAMETGTGVSALEDLAASLSSAGVANKDLAPSLKLANQMMVALGTDSSKTGGFIGGLSKAMGLSMDQIKTYASGLNVIENASRATSQYTMDFTEAMIPLGAMFKLDEKALLAFSAVAADAGLQAGETATSINSAVGIALADPDKMTNWATMLNMSVDELKQNMDRDLLGVLKKSAAALGKVTSSTEKATLANSIWGRYGMKSMGSLTGALANYDTYYQQVVQDTINGSQSMGTEQERVMGTLASHFARAKAIINDFGISVGNVTQGPLKNFFMWFEGNAKTMSTALEQALSGDLLGAFKTIGPVVNEAMAGIQSAFGSLVSVLSGLVSQINFGDLASRIMASLGELGPRIIDSLGGALSYIGSLPWESYFSKGLDAAEKAFANIGDAILNQPWGAWAGRAMGVLGSAMQTALKGAMDFGGWIQSKLSQVNNSSFISAGRTFAGWVIDGLKYIATLVKDNWSNWIVGAIIVTGTIATALGSFAYGMVTEIAAKVKGKASSIWEGLAYWGGEIVGSFKNLGANMVDAIGMGIASGVNAALQPIVDGLNYIMQKSNELLKTDFKSIGQISVGTGNTFGTSGNVGAAAGNVGSTLWAAGGAAYQAIMGGSSGENETRNKAVNSLTQAGFGTYLVNSDYLGFIEAQAAQGASLSSAKQLAKAANVGQNQTFTGDEIQQAWNKGKYKNMGGVTSGYTTQTQATTPTTPVTAASSSPYSAGKPASSNNILSLLNQGAGSGIVPQGYSVSGAVTDGMKVFVTNWPQGFNGGGFEQLCASCGPKGVGVDYGYAKQPDFTGNITPGGPGIGMVGSMSSTTPYANRLEVDTCEIDSFGMTPGLGAELARAGAWKPIQGSPVSEKLAAEIGYTGQYSDVGNTAMVGSIKQAYDKAQKTQIATQNKVNNSWTQSVAQTGTQQLTNGQMIGNIMVTSANFGANTQNASSQSWYNATQQASNNWTGASTQASNAILSSATLGGASINVAGSNLGSVLSGGSDRINTASTNLTNATGGLTGSISSLQGLFDSQTSQMGTLLGSLNATAIGLTSVGQAMGIPLGGAFISSGIGGGSGGATNSYGVSYGGTGWAGGTSISGAGGWVGSGSTAVGGRGYTTWGGTAASNAISSQSAGSYSWGGVTATKSSVSPSYWSSVVSKYAEGGMVNKPQLALIGEAGREAVLPNKLVETILRGSGGDTQMVHMTLNVDGKRLADVTGPAIIKRVQQAAGLKVR